MDDETFVVVWLNYAVALVAAFLLALPLLLMFLHGSDRGRRHRFRRRK